MPRPKPDRWIDDHVPEATWDKNAACRGLPPENNPFFQEDDDLAVLQAKKVCASCTVRPRCLEQALSLREQDGIWGGLTPAERRTVMKRRRLALA